jgi:hypothetical protein
VLRLAAYLRSLEVRDDHVFGVAHLLDGEA